MYNRYGDMIEMENILVLKNLQQLLQLPKTKTVNLPLVEDDEEEPPEEERNYCIEKYREHLWK